MNLLDLGAIDLAVIPHNDVSPRSCRSSELLRRCRFAAECGKNKLWRKLPAASDILPIKRLYNDFFNEVHFLQQTDDCIRIARLTFHERHGARLNQIERLGKR